jgi:hypothetical protein
MRAVLWVSLAVLLLGGTASAAPEDDSRGASTQKPPPINVHYLQSGVALAAELVPFPGAVCPEDAVAPCILGGGAGLAIRVGHRARRPWYFGGAYELTRHDSSNLLRLPILQQIRVEARRYVDFGRRLVPYAIVGAGATVYGNEFGVQTAGLLGSLGLGAEYQLNRSALVGAALAYRPMLVRRWTDSADQVRAAGPAGFGLAHVVSLEFTLEMRQQLSRW